MRIKLYVCLILTFLSRSEILLYAQGLNYIYKPHPHKSAVNLRYDDALGKFDIKINEDIKSNFEQVLTITDKNNNMVGYTNGRFVWGVEGDTIPNGDSLGWTKSWEMITSRISKFKTETMQSAVVLPTSNDSLWLLFYQDFVWKYDVDNFHLPYLQEFGEVEFIYTAEHLYMAKIRMQKDGSLYILPEERDIPLVKDFLIHRSLMVVQHANAKDFWILAPCQHNEKAYSILVSDSTVSVRGQHYFSDNNTKHIWFGLGCSRFNYSGDKIVRLNFRYFDVPDFPAKAYTQYIELMGFDRCQGKVTRCISLDSFPRPSDGYGAKMDAIFSKNDRYLYISERFSLVRKDLLSNTPLLVKLDTIIKYNRKPTSWAELNSFDNFSVLNYFPDGRIWMHGYGSESHFHLINYPDEDNISDIKYTSKYITLPSDPKKPEELLVAKFSHTWELFPRHPMECSPTSQYDFSLIKPKLYPNPTSDILYIGDIDIGSSISISHIHTGQNILNSIYTNEGIDVSNLEAGIYLLKVNGHYNKFIKI